MGYIGTKPQVATSLQDNIVTSDKIVAGAVTDAKIAAMAATKLTGTVPDANAPSGSVIQVVQGVLATPVVYSAQAWGDIGLSATITPSNTSNKVLVIVHIQVGGDGSAYDAAIALVRNSTQIALPTSYGSRNGSFLPFNSRSQSIYECTSISNSFLDSPSSTSALTYKLQGYANNGTGQYINRTSSDADNFGDSRHISTITLMEIAS